MTDVLPPELVQHVLSFLSLPTLFWTGSVCRLFYDLTRDGTLIKKRHGLPSALPCPDRMLYELVYNPCFTSKDSLSKDMLPGYLYEYMDIEFYNPDDQDDAEDIYDLTRVTSVYHMTGGTFRIFTCRPMEQQIGDTMHFFPDEKSLLQAVAVWLEDLVETRGTRWIVNYAITVRLNSLLGRMNFYGIDTRKINHLKPLGIIKAANRVFPYNEFGLLAICRKLGVGVGRIASAKQLGADKRKTLKITRKLYQMVKAASDNRHLANVNHDKSFNVLTYSSFEHKNHSGGR